MIISLTVLAALCLPVFIWWELRSANTAPIIGLRTYLNRNFIIGSIYVIILGMMLYGQLYVESAVRDDRVQPVISAA